jgi:hypothetical protein
LTESDSLDATERFSFRTTVSPFSTRSSELTCRSVGPLTENPSALSAVTLPSNETRSSSGEASVMFDEAYAGVTAATLLVTLSTLAFAALELSTVLVTSPVALS